MTRTTMLIVIGMVELAASMISVDGTPIAMIVIVWNANHLAGMEITIVTTVFSIPKIANGMVELAASMISVDGTPIAKIVIVWNANHLAGMEITIVMTVFSILKIANGMEEIAVVTASTQTTAPTVNALILKLKPGN